MMSKRATLSSDWFKLCWRIIFACLCALYFVLLKNAKRIPMQRRCIKLFYLFHCFTYIIYIYIYCMHYFIHLSLSSTTQRKKQIEAAKQTYPTPHIKILHIYCNSRSAYNIPFTTLLFLLLSYPHSHSHSHSYHIKHTMKLFSSSSLLYITITITTATVTVPTIMFLLSSSSSTLVSAFSPPSLLPSMPFKTSSSSSSSRSSSLTKLYLSDNLKDYRRGLSQIHKNGGDDRDLQNVDPNSNNNNNNNNKKQKLIKTVECVFKFGGSSIATAERIDHVANLIKDQIELGYKPRAVICSAMGKTTNNLLSAGEFALEGQVCIDAIRTLHTNTMNIFNFTEDCYTRIAVNELLTECEQMLTGVKMIQELSPKSLDQLVSYGERCSVRIMATRLNQIGVPSQAFDSWDIGILTDSNFGDAKLLPSYESEIQKTFSEKIDSSTVAVVTGFIGHDPNGRITTLGRGGSDLTATAIGAALQLDEIQVWKDVDGILSTDPRIVSTAIPLDQISFEEASELAYFGAQVLHPIAMQPAMKYNVPVRVKNSYNPSAIGTIIKAEKSSTKRLVTAITYKKGVTVLDICSTQMLGAYGFLARVFGEFEKHKLSVDVLASSEVSVSLTLDRKQDSTMINSLIKELSSDDVAKVIRKDNYSIITLIADVKQSSEVLATAFRVFSKHNIQVEMMSQGASKVNISFIIKSEFLETAIIQLHSCYFDGNCQVNDNDNDKEKKIETE